MCRAMSDERVALEAFSKDSHVCPEMAILSECETQTADGNNMFTYRHVDNGSDMEVMDSLLPP